MRSLVPVAEDPLQVWTVGHSNHSAGELIGLLAAAGIEVVVDIRSQPFSRRQSQFNREPLRRALDAAGLGYLFLGDQLGGRPPEPELTDERGRVDYGAVAGLARFRQGIDRLRAGAGRFRVAVLCSEEDPARCHPSSGVPGRHPPGAEKRMGRSRSRRRSPVRSARDGPRPSSA